MHILTLHKCYLGYTSSEIKNGLNTLSKPFYCIEIQLVVGA